MTAIGIVGYLSFYMSRNALNQRTFDQLTSLKVIKKRQIENYFADRIFEINHISGNLILNDLKAKDFIYLFKSNYATRFKYFNGVYLLDSTKNVKFIDFQTKPDTFLSLESLQKIRDLSYSINESKLIEYINTATSDFELFVPLKSGKISLLFELDKSQLNKIMYETNPKEGLGKSGESYIVGSDHRMRTKSRFINHKPINTVVNTMGIMKLQQESSGTSIYRDYRNVQVLGSFGKLDIQNLGWNIMVEMDLEEANAPILEMRNNILFVTLIIAAIVFIFTYILSRKISIPIVKLTESTKKIVSGTFEIIPQQSTDEIGILTSTFNKLGSTLKQQEILLEEERKKRSEISIEAMEKERLRLSRELHDGLGQSLISQKLMLESIDTEDNNSMNKVITAVKNSLDNTIDEIRVIINDLMPAVLFEFGLVNGIRKLCNQMNDISNIEITFDSNISSAEIEDKTKIYLYRITQECLKNTIQYSKCSKCMVRLDMLENKLILTIADNGVGFDQNVIREGNGLNNIKERINILKGSYEFFSSPGNGTTVKIELPIF